MSALLWLGIGFIAGVIAVLAWMLAMVGFGESSEHRSYHSVERMAKREGG